MWLYRHPPHSGSAAGVRRSIDGASRLIVSAYTTPFPTRSIRARTVSPGIAPDTRTTCPSTRAIIRPPAAGLSMVSVMTWSGVSISCQPPSLPRPFGDLRPSADLGSRTQLRDSRLGVRDGRQAETLSHEVIDSRLAGATKDLRTHRRPERGELVLRFAREGGVRLLVEAGACPLQQLLVEDRKPADQLLPRGASQPVNRAASDIQLGRHPIDQPVKLLAERPSRARRCQAKYHPLEMRRKRLTLRD